MNQKLKAIYDIISSLELDRELSFNVYTKILVKQEVNPDSFKKVKEKYIGINDILQGVVIFTSLGNKDSDYWLKRNLYKKPGSILEKALYIWRWGAIVKGDFYTIFEILDGEKFILSLFTYIDTLKEVEVDVLSSSVQRKIVMETLHKTGKEYGKDSFSLEIPIKKYFSDKLCYYKVINDIPNLTIRNISIFDGIIRYSVTMKSNELIQDEEIKWEEKQGFLCLYFCGKEKRFKKGKNTFYIVKESLQREVNEEIDFVEMIEQIEGNNGVKEQDKMKMVYNAVAYANNEITKELEIKDFFLVEEKAYKRQIEVSKI